MGEYEENAIHEDRVEGKTVYRVNEHHTNVEDCILFLKAISKDKLYCHVCRQVYIRE